jgi:GDPmannose 4,6-dehydratase
MWLMLQQEKPEDFVVATGETQRVRTFVEAAFAFVDITIKYVAPARCHSGCPCRQVPA